MKSIYLTLLAVALALPAMAQIEEGQEYTDSHGIVYTYGTDDWDWDDTSMSWILTDGLAAKGNVAIPSTILGEKVRIIGANSFRDFDNEEMINTKLTGITLPDNVEVIQMAAFLGCVNLKRIDLNNVHRVDYATFLGCTGLEEVHIRKPASEMSFGVAVFQADMEMDAYRVIPVTVYVPKGEKQNYIDKFCQPFDEDDEYPITWEQNVLRIINEEGRLLEEGETPQPGKRGDLNGDGLVDVTDVSICIDMVLGKRTPNLTKADLSGDGQVDVSDVSAVIDIVLGK